MTRWTVARQAPLSMGLSSQEYCSGLPFPSPGDLPRDQTRVSCIAGGFFTVCSSSQLLDEKLFEGRLSLFFQVLCTRSAHSRCSHTHRMKETMGRDVPGPTHPLGGGFKPRLVHSRVTPIPRDSSRVHTMGPRLWH